MPEFTIGFANMDERNPFCVRVREGLQEALAPHPEIDLIFRDNQLSNELAGAHIAEFVATGVDLVIFFHVDERENPNLVKPLRDHVVPIIAVEFPIPLTTYFGIDNRLAGEIAGTELAKWVQANWDGGVDKVLAITASSASSKRCRAASKGQ